MAISTGVEIGSLIYKRPDIHDGRPSISGTGISVQNIAILHNQGAYPEEIARRKYLTLAQVHAALAYYYANKDEIDLSIVEDVAEYSKLEEEWRKTRADKHV
jgi:uncharacterized protein (DUF433 family)